MLLMKKAYGIFPPMFTVWKKSDGTYDEKGTEKYIDWLIDNGIQSIVPCGSTGESAGMFMEEQKRVIEHVTKYVAGQIPCYAGTGKYSTPETLELSIHAKNVGVDGLMVILPYYYKPYKAAAMNHLREIHKATELPMILYNNPWFAGYELTAKEAKTLVDEGVLTGVKAAHGDANRVSDMKFECGDKMTVFYGHDYAALQGLAAGADGWLSGFPATFPKQCRALQEAVMVEKDLDKGRAIWDKFIPFINFFMDPEVNAQVHWLEMLKWAANVQGANVGIPRKPLKELDPEFKKRMEKPLEILLSI
ncbi:MAG: dihydrodipicolinate synthase family protein [Firmicutes bacterium]|nr:dihydrodipicolinate synthase family protein [Bacillota bacterium]